MVLINKNDIDGVVVNRNNTSGSEWASCHYNSTFGLDIEIKATGQTATPFIKYDTVTVKAVSAGVIRSFLGLSDSEEVDHLELKFYEQAGTISKYVTVELDGDNLDYSSDASVTLDVSADTQITATGFSCYNRFRQT